MKTPFPYLHIFTLLMMIGMLQIVSAQAPVSFPAVRVAVGAEALSSGNCHGLYYRPFAGIERDRNLVSAGPLIHASSGKVRGGRVSYSRNLSGSGNRYQANRSGVLAYDLIQLHLLTHFQYNERLPLSEKVRMEQEIVSRTADIDWKNVTLSTAETGAAIEIRVNLTRLISWRLAAGTAVHYHTKYVEGMSRDRVATTLSLGTGMLFVID
jgi:hypothetical protein